MLCLTRIDSSHQSIQFFNADVYKDRHCNPNAKHAGPYSAGGWVRAAVGWKEVLAVEE